MNANVHVPWEDSLIYNMSHFPASPGRFPTGRCPYHVFLCDIRRSVSGIYIMKLSARINSKNASQLPEITSSRNKHQNVSFAVQMWVNIATLTWPFGMLKALALKMLPCSTSCFQSFLPFRALPGWDTRRMQICHPCHSNNYSLTEVLCHILTSVHMTHHSAGKQEVLHSGRKSKGRHTSGHYPSCPSSVVIRVYLTTPKQNTFGHTIRKEDQGYEFSLHLTSWTPWEKELQPRACYTLPIPSWPHLSPQCIGT